MRPMLMNRTLAALSSLVVGLVLVLGVGCKPNEPPPARAPIPPPDARSGRASYTHENAGRPLPQQPAYDDSGVAAPFYDEPIVDQQLPEQPAFVEAYSRVGRPRITVFMNRTLDGQLMPIERGNDDWRDRDPFHSADRNDSNSGNNSYTATQYKPNHVDYEEMEAMLADWLSAGGQVVMISPTMANQRLSDQQKTAMQTGQRQALEDIGQSLNADVLVQVQARPTQQSRDSAAKMRIVAEAVNTRGGQSLGRASLDMPVPLEKTEINKATRFLARKLMSEMTTVWSAPPPPEMRSGEAPPATGPRIPESGHDVTPTTAPASVPAR